jgi:hypothetical protein
MYMHEKKIDRPRQRTSETTVEDVFHFLVEPAFPRLKVGRSGERSKMWTHVLFSYFVRAVLLC